ncbi:hypothetical protein NDU88_008947 [Pleurodeles waltl]|uniref:Secreted protein n=1 Tax=Pleurodeles waltl TaxID=8319 RepID=A0AAV7P2E8_PLEWA|nr:hypothetical protein NDU88_008947 [Pleurodeles waltl]
MGCWCVTATQACATRTVPVCARRTLEAPPSVLELQSSGDDHTTSVVPRTQTRWGQSAERTTANHSASAIPNQRVEDAPSMHSGHL